MTTPAKAAPPILGIIFLLLGLFKFINGGQWVVWIILGCLFGGLGMFTATGRRGA